MSRTGGAGARIRRGRGRPLAGAGERLGRGEEVVQQLPGRELGPQPVQCGPDGRVLPQGLLGQAEVRLVEEGLVLGLVDELLEPVGEPAGLRDLLQRLVHDAVVLLRPVEGERLQHVVDEAAPLHVVREAQGAGAVADLLAPSGVHDQGEVVGLDAQAAGGRDLPVVDGGLDEVGHAQAALDDGGRRDLGGRRLEARIQLADRGQRDVGLTQARQHLLDVAEERGVGADDEHSAAFEDIAVRVEEVRGPVQGGDRLAGAGAALDDQHALQAGPDDLVLLLLDGRDDVAHPAGPAAAERGEEGGLAHDAAAFRLLQALQVEHLVVQPDDLAVPQVQMAAARERAGRARGRGVERAGRLGAPVDQDGLAVLVAEPDAADVERVAGAARRPARWSMRPKHRPCSTPPSRARRRAASSEATALSRRAWNTPPPPAGPCRSAASALARSTSSRAYTRDTYSCSARSAACRAFSSRSGLTASA
ncbi:hypothetical protein [Actinomadura madurae]|uniref:hypothetical protein n=1 Tax=Actinomadura madurae TaxID=1993 RepID=UPI003FD83F17